MTILQLPDLLLPGASVTMKKERRGGLEGSQVHCFHACFTWVGLYTRVMGSPALQNGEGGPGGARALEQCRPVAMSTFGYLPTESVFNLEVTN